MKLKKLIIENCKSYLSKTEIDFEENFNVFVGPNGGGKSNTLDIITILLRHLMHGYTIVENREGKRINNKLAFQNLRNDIDAFFGHEKEDQLIEVVFEVQENDLENMRVIKDSKDDFEVSKSKYTTTPLNNLGLVDKWDLAKLGAEKIVSFKIQNGNLQNFDQDCTKWYREYLRYLELFIILANDIPNLTLTSDYLFFSPYRGGGINDLQANLSGQNYYNLLLKYYTSTSKDVTSLINIATLYFASKKRRLESKAKDKGYNDPWTEDDEVKLVTKYMNQLGYEWSLNLIDLDKNIYEIRLKKGEKEFNITKASSGEKEIFNFLLGIFGFQIKGGIIVVDEPELHLHPKWQNILRSLFLELSENTNSQIIITTHSPIFITPDTLPNIRRLSKSVSGSTEILKTGESDIDDRKSLLHIVNSHNNERMFFADHVVLVEGIQDRLVFRRLIDKQLEKSNTNAIIEVLEVHGKNNFSKYKNFLDGFGVEVSIIADRDYLINIKRREIKEYLRTDYKKIDNTILKSKKSYDVDTLIELLREVIKGGDTQALNEFIVYLEGRKTKLRKNLTEEEKNTIIEIINNLYSQKIYVLKDGEIEDYLPDNHKSLDKTIELTQSTNFNSWLTDSEDDGRGKELVNIAELIISNNGEFAQADNIENNDNNERIITD